MIRLAESQMGDKNQHDGRTMGGGEEQSLLCCGFLMEAEAVRGRLALRCLKCGTLWGKRKDGLFTIIPNYVRRPNVDY